MDVWNPRSFEPDECLVAQVGPLSLWLRNAGDELHIAAERAPDPEIHLELAALKPTSPPSEAEWQRWVVAKQSQGVRLQPVVPDRPLVVRPEAPLTILTQQEAVFFVSFPIWVRILIGLSTSSTVCEEPTVILSNTWFGAPMAGELCYSLTSRARRRIAETEPRPHRVVCPVRIRNVAPAPLEVERFCLHVEHLSIFAGARQLWTNEVQITFQGEGEVSRVNHRPDKPTYEPVERLISEPRVPLKQTLLKMSFSALRLFGGV